MHKVLAALDSMKNLTESRFCKNCRSYFGEKKKTSFFRPRKKKQQTDRLNSETDEKLSDGTVDKRRSAMEEQDRPFENFKAQK